MRDDLLSYNAPLNDYLSEKSAFTKALNDADLRKTLARILSSKELNKQTLFWEADDVPHLIEQIADLVANSKPIYSKWKQKVGSKERELSVPKEPLKVLSREYLSPFILGYQPHSSCHGGEVGWSPKKSLESHLPLGMALSFDLKDAFANVGFKKIFGLFYERFEELEYEERIRCAGLIASLCSVKYDGARRGLPQGSSTAMAIFNRIFRPFDEQLANQSRKRGFRYTRWVDDLTISSESEVDLGSMIGAIEVVENDFPIHESKTFFQSGKEVVYLLGHYISNDEISKNSTADRERHKIGNLNLKDRLSNHPYSKWVQ